MLITVSQIVSNFRKELDAISDPQKKVHKIADFATEYFDTIGSLSLPLLDDGIQISQKANFKEGVILCYANRFFYYFLNGDFKTAGIEMDIVDSLLKDVKDRPLEYSFVLNLKAYQHWFKGEFEKGFDVAFESLKYIDKIKGEKEGGWLYYTMGVFYFDTNDFLNSESYYTNSLKVFEETGYQYGTARAQSGLASVKIKQEKYSEAVLLLESATITYRKGNYYAGLSRTLNDLALIEKSNKNYKRAIELFNESIEIRKEINHTQGLITTHTELGEVYLLLNNNTEALLHLQQGLKLSASINAKYKSIRLHKLLSDAYKQTGDIVKAFDHFEKFHELKSNVLSEESAQNIRKMQTRLETEKSEREAEIERLKNVELKNANLLISEKNKEITDSINYAKRIQRSILPSDTELKKCFDNYFVFYQPKDIVSGDFYWAVNATSSKTGVNVSLIAAVDCTGHGVPGAFMSMLGNTLLNQTISNPEVIYPSEVLEFLNNQLPKNLKSSGQETSIRDGMDMSLCSFDMKNMTMYYAGANNPCWIIRNNELIELKADKQAISADTDSEKKPFTNQQFILQKNDRIYLFTDGYADQFGGEKGKKFKYKQLKSLLLANVNKTMAEQRNTLERTINEWKGNLEQVDDILVIGIQL